MKICHITSVHKHDDVRINLKECQSLALNHEVYLLVNEAKHIPKKFENIRVINLNLGFKSRLDRLRKSNIIFYEAAKKIDADIYHFHDPELLSVGKRLKRLGKKVIYDVHEDTPEQILAKDYIFKPFRKFISYIFNIYEKSIAKKLDGVVAATPYIEKIFTDINSNTININNYPILDEFMDLDNNFDNKKLQITYIGGLSKERGIFSMIKLANALPNINFVFCGEFNNKIEKNKAMELINSNNVDFKGHVPRNIIQNVLEESMIGLVLLEKNNRYSESLPIKMFEYMASGIPVIATDFVLWDSIVKENSSGFTVNPDDQESLRSIVVKLIQDKTLMKKIGDNGRYGVVQNYSWNKEAQKLLEFYDKMEED